MNRPTVVNSPPDILKNSRISLDMDTCQVFVGEKRVNNLTITEFNLLACLLKNAGKTLSRAALFEHCGMTNPISGTERTVDAHIYRLRSKLGMARYAIRTVRGVGYRMES